MMNKLYSEYFPSVSILISTKDRRDDLINVLSSIKELNYLHENIEIVVVEETDNPQPIEGVKYIVIPREGRGFGYTRNVAVKNASHDIVVFTDDDCIVEKDWLKEMVKMFIGVDNYFELSLQYTP